jgi:hypothetical protein
MRTLLAILVIGDSTATDNQSDDTVSSKATTRSYSEGWERIFAKGSKVHPGTDFAHKQEDATLCSICRNKSIN